MFRLHDKGGLNLQGERGLVLKANIHAVEVPAGIELDEIDDLASHFLKAVKAAEVVGKSLVGFTGFDLVGSSGARLRRADGAFTVFTSQGAS
jgi:hypothetical protein